MPKAKSSRSSLFRQWIESTQSTAYTTDGKAIYCQACQQHLVCEKVSHLTRHKLDRHFPLSTLIWYTSLVLPMPCTVLQKRSGQSFLTSICLFLKRRRFSQRRLQGSKFMLASSIEKLESQGLTVYESL